MLTAAKLSFRYDGSRDWALKDVDLAAARGECLVLTGPSGCGKSTLIKCLNGLVPHFERGVRAGRVLLDGVDLDWRPMHRIARRVGSVFQDPRTQFFTTRVSDEVAFGCENFGLPAHEIRHRTVRALERFGIGHLGPRRVFDLSSGERQRAILAAVYATGADIWVLDEPSANLDPGAVRFLEEALVRLKREGKTLIIAEHRCHYLRDLADRVVLFSGGRVVGRETGAVFFSRSNAEMDRRGLRWVHPPEDSLPTARGPDRRAEARLAAADLHFHYGKKSKAVLSGANLLGWGGDIVALAGPNGAGKTTLAMVLSGLLRARGGIVSIDGVPCCASLRIARCRLVFQETEHQLFTESVFREVALGLPENGGSRERVMELLAAVGLSDQSRRRPRRLSGGEKQRLAVAAAMAAGPAVLILDEPTSGLDARNMIRMGALLKQAAHGGALVMVVTHDEQFIQTCCTRVLRMENGGIIDG